jgi:P27 family predicted phage terminase small subunit
MTDRAPKGLNSEARTLWKSIMSEFEITDSGGTAILRSACETLTALRKAESEVETAGMVFLDRYGKPRAHPLMPVVRDLRAQYLAALKMLNLDLEPLRDRAPGKRR